MKQLYASSQTSDYKKFLKVSGLSASDVKHVRELDDLADFEPRTKVIRGANFNRLNGNVKRKLRTWR